MRKIVKLFSIVFLGLLLVACGSNDGVANDGETIKIGILQYMEHNSLTAAKDGFVDELEQAGIDVEFEVMNAQGDQANLQSMSEQLSTNNDIILAIATPAAQSLATVENEKPILFTAVTDPVDAGLVDSNEEPNTNLTGTSDMVPINEQIALLLSIIPDATTVGIVYNSSEPNSEIQANLAIDALEASGIEARVSTVTSTNEVQTVVASLAQDVDGLYIPTDNTLASTMATVGEIAIEEQIPVVAGDSAQVENGGLATYGISYEELGRQTARMALEIIQNDATPQNLAVQTSENLELAINEEMADALGIDPDSISVD